MESKNVLKSKTVWSNLLMAALAFYPPAHEFISQNVELYAMFWAGLNAILRVISKGKIELY